MGGKIHFLRIKSLHPGIFPDLPFAPFWFGRLSDSLKPIGFIDKNYNFNCLDNSHFVLII